MAKTDKPQPYRDPGRNPDGSLNSYGRMGRDIKYPSSILIRIPGKKAKPNGN